MSFHFMMYRGSQGLPPITQWKVNMAEPIGSNGEVLEALSQLLESVRWEIKDDSLALGSALDPRYNVRYTLTTYIINGVVSVISASNHASPFTLAKIMDRFNLNYCCTEFGDFRTPHTSDDNWLEIGLEQPAQRSRVQ